MPFVRVIIKIFTTSTASSSFARQIALPYIYVESVAFRFWIGFGCRYMASTTYASHIMQHSTLPQENSRTTMAHAGSLNANRKYVKHIP